MVKGQKYVDVCDGTRLVEPTGNGDECRIYFDGCFAGKAQVPASLFGNERCGFILPPPPVTAEDLEGSLEFDDE